MKKTIAFFSLLVFSVIFQSPSFSSLDSLSNETKAGFNSKGDPSVLADKPQPDLPKKSPELKGKPPLTQTREKEKSVDNATRARGQKVYGKLPLYFIQNDGQMDERVKFYEKGAGHTTFFTKEGVYLSLGRRQKTENRGFCISTRNPKPGTRYLQIRISQAYPFKCQQGPRDYC